MKITAYLQKIRIAINNRSTKERQLLALGRLLSETVKSKKKLNSLSEVEFKVFSQWGDDGIIQWLSNNLEFPLVRPQSFMRGVDLDEYVGKLFFRPNLIRFVVDQVLLWVYWMRRRLA